MSPPYYDSRRRILSFTAVRPCESISSSTLLSSLVDMCHNILNYKTKSISTQKKNLRQTIRQISILALFFEEIRENNLVISDSVMLSFSELHVIFQKILFLLEDLSCNGGKLWLLMKSQFVASQILVLNRSLATALDVLPINRVGICDEVKEMIELVSKQSRTVSFDVDPDDELAAGIVMEIINRFEKKMEPDWSMIKHALHYLEIKTWNDCDEEIRFLEEEILFNFSDSDAREAPLVSSLIGLMNYSRGVIFETLDFRRTNPANTQKVAYTISCLNPNDFLCPISLDVMTDPVTVSTGHTYDRVAIERWIAGGNLTCPKTGEKLKNTELVPNITLLRLIKQYCQENNVPLGKSGSRRVDISRTNIPGSPAAEEAMKLLSKFLSRRLVFGTNLQKNKAAYEIRLLGKSNIFNRNCLIKAGTVPLLLGLLSNTEKAIQENAITALFNLSKHGNGKREIMENAGLKPIFSVLKGGLSLEARQMAAATLFYLSSEKEYRKIIGESSEAILGLVELIKEGTNQAKKNAMASIFALLLSKKNHEGVIQAGTIPLLGEILSSSNSSILISDSLEILAVLAAKTEGTKEILRTSSISQFVGLLQSLTSRHGKEHCASILYSLCINGGDEVTAILASDTALMGSLYSLITDGSPDASKKASLLIRILQNVYQSNFHDLRISAAEEELLRGVGR